MIQRCNNRETLTVAIIVCAVFVQFFVVDHWAKASGVLSVVTFGVLLSKEKDKARPMRSVLNAPASPAHYFNMECVLA